MKKLGMISMVLVVTAFVAACSGSAPTPPATTDVAAPLAVEAPPVVEAPPPAAAVPSTPAASTVAKTPTEATDTATAKFKCPMNHFYSNEPGVCPKCGMTLEPNTPAAGGSGHAAH